MNAEQLTREWVTRLVVGEGLCPFAHPVLSGLLIEVCDSDDLDQVTRSFMELVEQVATAAPAELPTALFVVPNALQDFDEYWNWNLICDELSAQMGHEGELQIATFHPHYQFDGEDDNDPSHYTNRSPFPMLHIIREADIEAALASVAFPERIPERNQKHMRRLGVDGLLERMPALKNTAVFK